MTQNSNQTQAVATMKAMQEGTVNAVLERVKLMQDSNDLHLPEHYHPGNQLKLAWLQLQNIQTAQKKPVLEACTKESICNAMLEMVIKGMSVAKKQGYFIAYGNQLTFQPDYRGNLMIAKRDADVKTVNAQVIYEGDKYVTKINELGEKQLVSHETSIDNVDITKIKGAYAVVVFNDGRTKLEEMTIQQIRQAWAQGAANGNSGAHKNFTDQMCKKTVINRALKIEIGSSDDADWLEPTPSNENQSRATTTRNEQVQSRANSKPLPVEEAQYEEISETPQQNGQQTEATPKEEVKEPEPAPAAEVEQKERLF